MHVLILGGSGFIGSALVKALLYRGHSVHCTTRGATKGSAQWAQGSLDWLHWDGSSVGELFILMRGGDVVINLLGENIAAKRWSRAQKDRILHSRTKVGNAVSQAFLQCKGAGHTLPHTLVQASACGFYGTWEDATTAPLCTEASPVGQGFLAETCVAWEASTTAVEGLGVRRCILRTAPVLGPGGGFLQKMLPVFRLGLGGVLGTGKQPMSWVHLDDVVGAIIHLMEHPTLTGVCNVSAPSPVTMREFVRTLGHVLHRPTVIPVPALVLKALLGQMAQELLLTGQLVQPVRLQAGGYDFVYPQLEEALKQILHPRT